MKPLQLWNIGFIFSILIMVIQGIQYDTPMTIQNNMIGPWESKMTHLITDLNVQWRRLIELNETITKYQQSIEKNKHILKKSKFAYGKAVQNQVVGTLLNPGMYFTKVNGTHYSLYGTKIVALNTDTLQINEAAPALWSNMAYRNKMAYSSLTNSFYILGQSTGIFGYDYIFQSKYLVTMPFGQSPSYQIPSGIDNLSGCKGLKSSNEIVRFMGCANGISMPTVVEVNTTDHSFKYVINKLAVNRIDFALEQFESTPEWVIVFGGKVSNTDPVKLVELFNVETHEHRVGYPLEDGYAGYFGVASALVDDRYLYIAGGISLNTDRRNRLYRYDIKRDSWIFLKNNFHTSPHAYSNMIYENGKIFLLYGHDGFNQLDMATTFSHF